MAIRYNPALGTILLCDFHSSIPPEMNKKRPVIVLSCVSDRLCIVVPMSTTPPANQKKWHYLLRMAYTLPFPYNAAEHWVKCDMVNTVSFDRLVIPRLGKDAGGRRIYANRMITPEDMNRIADCVKAALFP